MNLSKTIYAREQLNTVRDRPPMRACRHPTDARRLTPANTASRCSAAIGADRVRTGNLRVANAALSRLSYGPGGCY